MKNSRYGLTMLVLLLLLGPVAAQESEDRARDHYSSGRAALDDSDWNEAIRQFDRVIGLKAGSEEGSYYWKAYALYKKARSREALETLALRREQFPDGRWADDARALEMEIKRSAGQAPDPEAEEDLELKLIALNALLNVDEDRAIPIVEKILAEETSFQMKEQALFVLVQSGSPRAREILLGIARGGSNPDLQLAALQHMGMFGEDADLPVLKEVYASSTDRDVKQAIIMSYGFSGATDELLAVIETEEDRDLRREALVYLGHSGGGEELARLYDLLDNTEDRIVIVEALAMTGESEALREIIGKTRDSEVRNAAIRSLGFDGDPESRVFLLSLYREDPDREVRSAVLESLMMQDDAPGLIEIARTEKDLELKKRAVEMLAMMSSPEATEFLMGILDE